MGMESSVCLREKEVDERERERGEITCISKEEIVTHSWRRRRRERGLMLLL